MRTELRSALEHLSTEARASQRAAPTAPYELACVTGRPNARSLRDPLSCRHTWRPAHHPSLCRCSSVLWRTVHKDYACYGRPRSRLTLALTSICWQARLPRGVPPTARPAMHRRRVHLSAARPAADPGRSRPDRGHPSASRVRASSSVPSTSFNYLL